MPVLRHPEVRAISALTRVFDALWRASKGDGTQIGGCRLGTKRAEIGGPISVGASAASFEGRFAAASMDDLA